MTKLEFAQSADDRQCDPSLEPSSHVTAFQTVRLIPAVLKRILSCVHPADNVNCLPAQWHLQSVASTQIRFRLVEPKNGTLLLKWPTSFHNREDVRHPARQYRFINLVRYNVARELASGDENLVIQQVRLFLAGHEALMLNVVLANMELYANLNTFMVDFNAVKDETRLFYDFDSSKWHGEQFLPFENRSTSAVTALTDQGSNLGTHVYHQFGPLMLFMDSELWVKVITAVAKECGGSLLHFIMTDRVCPTEPGRLSRYVVTLPRQFYRSLQLEPMLADMQKLRTLYLPSVNLYEVAGGERGVVSVSLPNLRRVFLDAWSNQWAYAMWNDSACLTRSRLSCFWAASDVKVECRHLACDQMVPPKCPLFPCATVTVPIADCFDISEFNDSSDDFSSAYIEKSDSVAASLLSDKLRYFLDVLAPQRYEVINRTENDLEGQDFAGNARAYIRFQIAPFYGHISPRDTLKVVLSLLRERQRRRCNRTCLTIVIGYPNYNWVVIGGILDILPFFVATNNEDDGSCASNQVNDVEIQIVVKTDGSSFSSSMKLWKNKVRNIRGRLVCDEDRAKYSEYKQQLLSKQFKLPKICLQASPVIFVKPDVPRGREFPYRITPKLLNKKKKLVKKIETLAMHEVLSFVRDAVECCRPKRPRDVCFYMYQSLKSCTFTFYVIIEERKWPNVSVEIRRILRNRAALFEQTVLQAVFKELLPAGLHGEIRPWLYKDTPMLINVLGSIARNLTIVCEGLNRVVPFQIYRSQSRLKKGFK